MNIDVVTVPCLIGERELMPAIHAEALRFNELGPCERDVLLALSKRFDEEFERRLLFGDGEP